MSKLLISLGIGLITLISSVIKKTNGRQRLEDALVKEELIEDKIEKKLIRKADDIINWWKIWDTCDNSKLLKKYHRYVKNKIKEYDKIRGAL